MNLSVIIPVLNEAEHLSNWLEHLIPLRDRGVEIIVVDGGSQDDSVDIAACWGARVLSANKGRAKQMNAGAVVACGDVLLFLHADTVLPVCAEQKIFAMLTESGRVWGRFSVRIHGRPWMLRVISHMMNGRSCLTGIATGDQAMFLTRQAFRTVGGFPDQPLMEDIALSKRLLVLSRPICLSDRVVTSGRRWETHGVWRTVFLMWRLRWDYWRGVSADALSKAYRPCP